MSGGPRVLLVICAASAVALVSCANSPAPGDGELDPTASLAPCTASQPEYAPAIDFLSSVERWLEVVEPSSAFSDPALDENGTAVVDMVVAPVRSIDSVGATTTESIALHASFLPGLGWALDNGGRAFLALGSRGLEQELVLYVLIRSEDGTHFFGGECAQAALTVPVAHQLGERMDQALDALVGLTDQAAILVLLRGPIEPAPPLPTILNPEDVPQEVLESLTSIAIALDRPKDWVGAPSRSAPRSTKAGTTA